MWIGFSVAAIAAAAFLYVPGYVAARAIGCARVVALVGFVEMVRQDASFPSRGLRAEIRVRALRAECGTDLPDSARHALRGRTSPAWKGALLMAPRTRRRLSQPSHTKKAP